MSFYLSEQKRKNLYGTEYEFFLKFQDPDSLFRELIRRIDDQFSNAVISDDLLQEELDGVARDMNLILEAGGKLDRTCTRRALSDKFAICLDRRQRQTSISRRNTGPNLYLERRYWDQEQTLAFCIAARLSYDQSQILLGPMLGQPWLYLRDPFTLTCDFALQTHLSAEQTAQLLTYTQTVLDQTEAGPADTDGTEHIRDLYNTMLLPGVLHYGADPMEEFRTFIDYEKHNLRGDFSRTCALIRDLIRGREIPALGLFPDQLILHSYLSEGGETDAEDDLLLSTAHLGKQLARTFVPWERKGKQGKSEKTFSSKNLLTPSLDSSNYFRRRIRAYLKTDSDYSSLGFSEMRNDLLRLLLMYGTVTSIRDLNRILIDHSFCALNPEHPFDYLICAALIYGTGPRRNDSNANPYGVLIRLMDCYRAWSAGQDREHTTGGLPDERE